MATPDDIKLLLAVETAGVEGVTKLASELDKLAKEGGDAAPEFELLASELRKIAQQGDAVTQLSRVTQTANDLATQFADARARADALKLALDEQKASLEANGKAQSDLKKENIQLAAETSTFKTQLAALRAEQKASADGVENFAVRQKELSDKITANTLAVAENKRLLVDLAATNKTLSEEVSKTQRAYSGAETAVKRLGESNSAAQEDVQRLLSTLKDVGLEANDAAEAEKKLLAAMEGVKGSVDASLSSFEKSAQVRQQSALAAKEAAAQDAFAAESARRNAEVMYAALFDEAEARRKVAQERKDQAQAAIAEEDRLYAIQQQNLAKLRAAAEAERAGIVADVQSSNARVVASEQEKYAAIRRAAEQATQEISDAFSKTGVRSISAIQAEIGQIQQAMLTLSRSSQVSAADFDRAWQAGQNRIKELETELRTIPGHISATAQVTELLRNQFVQLAAAYSTIELGKKFIDANIQIESTRRALTLVTGSSQEASRQIQFLRDTANTSGQSFGALSETFVKFAAATKGAGIPLETMQDVFKGITNAAGQLGISSARTSLMLDALAQMASKGTVSMEELRQQLGDSLPGALNIAAKGLGLSEEKLVKLVETGKLTTQEFFPAFSRGLRETFGDADTEVTGVLGAFNRLKNAITEVAQQASDSTAWKGLATGLDAVASNMGTVVTSAGLLVKAFVGIKAVQMASEWLGIGKAAKVVATETAAATTATVANTQASVANTQAAVANTVATRENAAAKAATVTSLSQIGNAAVAVGNLATTVGGKVAGAIRGVTALIGGIPGLLVTVALSYKELGTGIADLAARFTGLKKELDDNEKKLKQLDEEGIKRVKKAQQELADKMYELGLGLSQINVKYDELIDKEQKAVVSKGKLVDAAKIAADASEKLAAAVGDEMKIRETAVAANQKVLEAQLVQQRYIQTEIKDRDEQIKKLKEYVDANGGASAAVNKAIVEQIDKLKLSREERAAEAEKINQSVEALRLEKVTRELSLETYKDNALRIDELTDALVRNKEASEYMRVQLVLGRTTQEAYDNSLRNVVASEALLNDALKDAAAAADRKIAALQRTATQTEANLNIDKARIQTEGAYLQRLLESARAEESYATRMGDTARAAQAAIDQKNIEIRIVSNSIDMKEMEIKVLRAKIDASNAEAKATLAAADAEKASLEATGQLTEAKKAEIEARIAAAKLKQTEAQLNAENIKQIEEEISALRAKRSIAADEAYTAEAAKESEIAARERNISAIDGETAALKRKRGVDEQGFSTDMAGNRIVATGDTPLSAYNALKSYGVEDARAKQIASSLFDAYGNTITNYGSITTNPMLGENFGTLLSKIAQSETMGAKTSYQNSSGGGSTSSAPTTSGTPVIVNINGVPTTINASSPADAQAFVKVIGDAYKRAGFQPLG